MSKVYLTNGDMDMMTRFGHDVGSALLENGIGVGLGLSARTIASGTYYTSIHVLDQSFYVSAYIDMIGATFVELATPVGSDEVIDDNPWFFRIELQPGTRYRPQGSLSFVGEKLYQWLLDAYATRNVPHPRFSTVEHVEVVDELLAKIKESGERGMSLRELAKSSRGFASLDRNGKDKVLHFLMADGVSMVTVGEMEKGRPHTRVFFHGKRRDAEAAVNRQLEENPDCYA